MGYLETLLQDRVNCFEIDSELMIRKWLENTTDYHYEFQKNDDKYGYDIICNRYDINGGEWAKNSIGFIEVEMSENWVTSRPANWVTHSFLARKMLNFDGREFRMELRDGAEQMLYIIFNKSMTDCVAVAPVDLLKHNPRLVRLKQTSDPRKDFVVRVPLSCPIVASGTNAVAKKVESFITGN